MNDSVTIRHACYVDIAPELLTMLKEFGATPNIEQYDDRGRIQASIEWAVSAIVVLYITKRMFDEFLKGFLEGIELGGLGKKIGTAIKSQVVASRKSEVAFCSSADISRYFAEGVFSGRKRPLFEIMLQLEEHFNIRFVFPASVNEQDVDKALEMLRKDFEDITSKAFDLTDSGLTVYIPSENRWLSQREVLLFVKSGGKV